MRIPLILIVLAVVVCFGLHLLLPRTVEFRAQARRGQPIVRAIEDFKKQNGAYPVALTVLVPKYLPDAPDVPDRPNHKYDGWDYHTITNGGAVTYSLRYYMGRGGVEYEPPVWVGINEGHRAVLLRND